MEQHILSHNELVTIYTVLSARAEDVRKVIFDAPEDEPSEVTRANLQYRYDLLDLVRKIDRMVEFSREN